jgi:hypothetical protein
LILQRYVLYIMMIEDNNKNICYLVKTLYFMRVQPEVIMVLHLFKIGFVQDVGI